MSGDPMAADFRRAAQIIRDKGLSKGAFESRGGKHCAAGAIITAVVPEIHFGRYMQGWAPAQPHLNLLATQLGWNHEGWETYLSYVATWNDNPDRTQDEVVATLESIADRLEIAERVVTP